MRPMPPPERGRSDRIGTGEDVSTIVTATNAVASMLQSVRVFREIFANAPIRFGNVYVIILRFVMLQSR